MTFKSRNTIKFIQIQFSVKECPISTVQLRWRIVSHHILFQKRTDSLLHNITDSNKVSSKHLLSLDLIQMTRMFTQRKIFSLKISSIKLCTDLPHRNQVRPLESAADFSLLHSRLHLDTTKVLNFLITKKYDGTKWCVLNFEWVYVD